MSQTISALKTDAKAQLPTRAHPDDAGMDLYALDGVTVQPGEGQMVRTGVALALPAGHVGLVADRSSLAKKGLKTAGGVIDAGYRGEIQVVVWNLSKEVIEVRAGDRCAQLLIFPVVFPQPIEVSAFEEVTHRGSGGFGSTGA